MENPYILMIVALAILAVVDLVVGVSNDAVNFLNSAIGSKVITTRNILIIASLGVFVGAVTSSGMMEVARKGIFVPAMFNFQNIMYIFMAVMITDILLLDVFNTLGLPTSTTVSIVFELLGAAVAMAFIKMASEPGNTATIWEYINYAKASMIIFGILLSVVVAFSIGALVQFISRLLYSFKMDKRDSMVNIIFGGFALASISYFIFFKGFKGTSFYKTYDLKHYLEDNLFQIFGIGFLVWTAISFILTKFTKVNILHVIIAVGTFSLALAFSGNDLVNFVGVPIAAWNSYTAWIESGIPATEFSMGILGEKVAVNNNGLLLAAGGIMVATIWFSKKSKEVIKTGIDLSRQDAGQERFQPTVASRLAVRSAMFLNGIYEGIMPKSTQEWVNTRFERPVVALPKSKEYEMPAFDTVRASVNLVVAGILISIGTSQGLPLSTTYVTFMVAMGTSLADRAWGRESAVYRVAGVLNVIGGWFATAFTAFTAAAFALYLINLGGIVAVSLLLILVTFLISRNYINYAKKQKVAKSERKANRQELITISGVIDESTSHISEVVRRVNKLYTSVAKDLASHDLNKLKKTDKHVDKLNNEVEKLKDEVFYFIKKLDETSAEASRFYIMVIGYLQDISQSISYISQSSYKHVNNNHKNLKESQITELSNIDDELGKMLSQIEKAFNDRNFNSLNTIILEKNNLYDQVAEAIEEQVKRIRKDKTESSPKNTTLFFGILLETKDLIRTITNMLELFQEFDLNIKKAKAHDKLL